MQVLLVKRCKYLQQRGLHRRSATKRRSTVLLITRQNKSGSSDRGHHNTRSNYTMYVYLPFTLLDYKKNNVLHRQGVPSDLDLLGIDYLWSWKSTALGVLKG
jgi:hypothetical protein